MTAEYQISVALRDTTRNAEQRKNTEQRENTEQQKMRNNKKSAEPQE